MSASLKAQNSDWPVQEYRLENGLKILVWSQHRVPLVVSQIWYRVGSSYEQEGKSGLSHVLEHMMFKGTQNVPGDSFSRQIAAHGGRENAFTSRDYTAYYQTISSEHLELCLRLEADRMQNLLMREADFKKEREVVLEERRLRYDDQPRSLLSEQLNATAYTQSGYRIPTIGWEEDLKNLTLEDLQQWYQRWYAPNNATLVVIGDVSGKQVKALAERYFGPIPASDLKTVPARTEQLQQGAKRIELHKADQLPYLLMGFKAPVLKTAQQEDEVYALTVLAALLDAGSSARLERHLVREQGLLTSVAASYDGFERLENLFLLAAVPVTGVNLDQARAGLLAEIKRLQLELVDEQELQRVKAQVLADSIYEQDQPAYLARQLGMADALGLDWRLLAQFSDRIQAVSAAQVRAVARKYLIRSGLTEARLIEVEQ